MSCVKARAGQGGVRLSCCYQREEDEVSVCNVIIYLILSFYTEEWQRQGKCCKDWSYGGCWISMLALTNTN